MNQTMFLSILKSALEGASATISSITKEESDEILRLAESHKILPLIYDCITTCDLPLDKEAATYLQRKVRLTVAKQALRTKAFLDVYCALESMGLTPVVVKGIVCRNLYPKPDFRISADEDLLIPSDMYDSYRDALVSLGFSPKNETPGSYQTSFFRSDGFHIELHTSLFDANQTYFEQWNELFSKAHSRSIRQEIEAVRIRTLCPTDHLMYLILHALKHFIHSGVGIRQVCDILLFAHKHYSLIDWDCIFTQCENLSALRFFMGLISIGKKHLIPNLNIPKLSEQMLPNEDSLLHDILCAGVYGGSTMSRKHSGSITFSAAKKGKKQRLLCRAFPEAKALEHQYPYIKRTPVLLPVAWSSRLIKYSKEILKTKNNSPTDAVNIANTRMALMKEYGLIPQK